MLGHIGINIPDLAAGKAYYDELMPLFGFEQFLDNDDEFAYRPADNKRGTFLFFYPSTTSGEFSREHTGLQHLAFMVRTRDAVHEAHTKALALGSESVSEPQNFPQYPPPYFAAFWLDPFGIMVEAVCHHDR